MPFAKMVARALLLFFALLVQAASAAPFAYIVASGSVQVIDVATSTTVTSVGAGAGACCVAVNVGGNRAYIANNSANTVTVIDTLSNTVVTTIPVGLQPRGIAINPGGTRVYVANANSNSISVIDTSTNTVIATIGGGAGFGVAVDPSGSTVYVANLGGGVMVIDASTNAVITGISVGAGAVGVAVSGTRAYVGSTSANSVSVIDTATFTVVATIPVAGAWGVALDPSASRLYVTTSSGTDLTVIDTATDSVIATIPLGASSYGVAVDPSGAKAYVTSSPLNQVKVIDTASNTVVQTIGTASNPQSLGAFIGGPLTPPPPTAVTNTNDAGTGSLRDAITFVNANCAGQTITFGIPGTGVHTIQPGTPLPAVTCANVTIDGYSQPGASANSLAVGSNAVILIEIDGTRLSNGIAYGLRMFGANGTVRGLAVNRCLNSGVLVSATGTVRVLGNFLGTDATGSIARANFYGIQMGTTTIVGDGTPAGRNVISGNSTGVEVDSANNSSTIEGNYIGTNPAGTAAVANSNGIKLDTVGGNTVLNTQILGNTISGNFTAIRITDNPSGTVIQRNVIGTDPAGITLIPNTNGITGTVFRPVLIGGTAGQGNVISGNTGVGIGFSNPNTGIAIQGNWIGTDRSGIIDLGNATGVQALYYVQVGGTGSGAGNVIAFNGVGVAAYGTGNAVLGNSIYLNSSIGMGLPGSTVMPNDACDLDTGTGNGTNKWQNYPVLDTAVSSGGSTTIVGNATGEANATLRIEFFSNLASDNASNSGGRAFLGYTTVVVGPSPGCSAPLNVVLPIAVAAGDTITATATDAAGNTGWFSNAIAVSVPAGPPAAPSITLTPSSVSFSARTVGTTSSAQTITLANHGPPPLTIASITVSGDYAFTSTCAAALASGSTCTIDVTFTPLATGSRTGAVTITSDASGSPHTVALSGSGLATAVGVLEATPSPLQFDPQAVGSTSGAQLLVLRNTGNATVNRGPESVDGDFRLLRGAEADAATQNQTCGAAIAAGDSCKLALVFAPTAIGTRAGAIALPNDGTTAVVTVRLIGTGATATAPRVLSVQPQFLSFGSQAVGTRSGGRTVTLTNNSSATAAITELSASPRDFIVSESCTTIGSRASCSPLVAFQPTAVGPRSGTLTIRTFSEVEPYLVTLTGTGVFNAVPALEVSVTRIGFGNVLLGGSSVSGFTVTNIGLVPVVLGALNLTSDFAVAAVQGCNGTLDVGAVCQFQVTFFPHIRGVHATTLQIFSNAANSPHRVDLSGTGCAMPTPTHARARPLLCGP